jgi:long-chain acyl-CoA synthetase
VQADCIEVGATIAYFGGDTTQIVAELAAVKPTVLPSVPRIFEKVYAVAMSMVPAVGEQAAADAIALGCGSARASRSAPTSSRVRARRR